MAKTSPIVFQGGPPVKISLQGVKIMFGGGGTTKTTYGNSVKVVKFLPALLRLIICSFSGGHLGPNRFWEEFSVQCSSEAGLHRWRNLHWRGQLEQNATSEVEESLWRGASGNSGSGNSFHPLSWSFFKLYFCKCLLLHHTESLHLYGTIPHEPRPLWLP